MDEDREDKVIMLAENKQQGENTISKPSWCAEMLSQIHKVIFVSEGKISETFKVQTMLTGIPRYTDVTLSVTYKVSDIFGEKVEGNGTWGRRIDAGNKLYWICEEKVDNYPEAADTVPNPTKEVTKEFYFSEINKFGVITINMYDFFAGDVVEITSIKYNGKEVLVK